LAMTVYPLLARLGGIFVQHCRFFC